MFAAISVFCARFTARITGNGIYQMLVAIGALSVIGIGYGAFQYWMESDDRERARLHQAWTYLMAARGPLGELEYDKYENCKVANWGLMGPLKQLAKAGEDLESLNLPNAYLKSIVVPGIQLPKARLFCATLDNSDFSEANLSGAQIEDANISCVDLSGANLKGAKLLKSGFRKSNLTGTDLTRADFGDATLRATIFKDAILTGADFTRADFDQTDLREADLSQTKGIGPKQLDRACMAKGSTRLPAWSDAEMGRFNWPKACESDRDDKIVIENERACD